VLQLDRREWILGILTASLLSGISPTSEAQSAPGTAESEREWVPRSFTVEQNETVIALGERIVPGSAEALCNRLIDLVLPIESEKNKREFLASLDAFDHEAENLFGRRFRNLDAASQDKILSNASEQGDKLFQAFQIVKEWMTDTYWSSLKGLRELGWTGRVAWDKFPGCPNIQSHS
jgi:hypothetical protein